MQTDEWRPVCSVLWTPRTYSGSTLALLTYLPGLFQVGVRMLCLWSSLIICQLVCMQSELTNSWVTGYVSLGLVLTVPLDFPLLQKTPWEFIDHWHLPVVVLIVNYIFWLGWGVIFSFFHPFILSKSLPFLAITEEV